MKKKVSLFLAMLMLCNLLAVSVSAEETQSAGETTPSAPTQAAPTDPVPEESTAATQPEQDSTQSTTAPTDPPKPCIHEYGEWAADEAAHGRTCMLCGYSESNSHSWAAETVHVPPTCKDGGGSARVCTVCQMILITELLPPLTTHTYDNSCDSACNVCGATREVTHSYGTGWTYSYQGHWHKCTVCGAAGETKSHYPGPAATEEKNQICLTCGYIMTKKLQHTHKFTSDWSTDENGHWYSCSGCSEKKDYSEHSFEDGCDTDCSLCGYIRDAAHEFGIWLQDTQGHWQQCSICDEESEHIAHALTEDAAAQKLRCSICQYTQAAAHTHDYSEIWSQDASGHWRECSCGETDQSGTHVWDAGREADGVVTFTCEICSAEKQEEVPERDFPWLLFAAGGATLLCLIGIVICILALRRKDTDFQ